MDIKMIVKRLLIHSFIHSSLGGCWTSESPFTYRPTDSACCYFDNAVVSSTDGLVWAKLSPKHE